MSSPIQQSPGVLIKEIDLTNFVPFNGISGGGFVGQFNWGPVEHVTTVSDVNQLVKMFGKPTDVNFTDWFSAYNFLSYTNNLKLVRTISEMPAGGSIATTYAYNAAAVPDDAAGSGVLIKNADHFQHVISSLATDGYEFAARYPGAMGNSIAISMADAGSYNSWGYKGSFDFAPGTSDYAANLGASNDEVHIVIYDALGLFTGVVGSILEKFAFLSKASDAKSLDGEPIFYGTVLNESSQYLWYLGAPGSGNMIATENGDSVASITVGTPGTGYVSPTVTVADPTSGVTALASATLETTGGIAVEVSVNSGGSGHSTNDVITLSNGVQVTVATENAGAIQTVTITDPGTGLTGDVTADPQSSTTGSGTGATFDVTAGFAIASIAVSEAGSGYTSVPTITITDTYGSGAAATAVMAQSNTDAWAQNLLDSTGQPRAFQSLDGAYTVAMSAGNNGEVAGVDEMIVGWSQFRDSEVVEVSLLFTGDGGGESAQDTVNQYVIDNICESRKDCVMFCSPALTDVLNKTQADAQDAVLARRDSLGRSSNYAVMDSGWKIQYDPFNDQYRWIPLNADIAGLCAATDATNDPWWSPAGYNRGRIKNVVSLAFNPNQTSRDELYKKNVNPVTTFSGEGTVLFGDKTLQYKPSAFQWINVRRLFLILEKNISRAAKYYLFEFNDQFTRAQFRNMVEPFLREVQGRRGIYDFRVVCDTSNNTGEVIDRGEFVASIFVKPTRSINWITLNFVAVKTGVEFSEVTGSIA